MVRYQFQIDEETWTAWKRTVPREKSLETRIIELIEADCDGRVRDADGPSEDPTLEDETPTPDAVETPLHAPAGAVSWTQSHAPASRGDIIAACYDDEAVDVTADTWWRKRVRPTLEEAGLAYERNVGWK